MRDCIIDKLSSDALSKTVPGALHKSNPRIFKMCNALLELIDLMIITLPPS